MRYNNYNNFEIVTLSDHNRNLGQIYEIGGEILRGILSIFGGGSDSGLPGDYDNRVRSAHQWAIDFGVKECVDFRKIERFIIEPGIWQGKLTRYYNALRKQKMETGSCQSVFGGGGGGATLFPGTAQLSPWVVIALIGGGIFLLTNKKRKR